MPGIVLARHGPHVRSSAWLTQPGIAAAHDRLEMWKPLARSFLLALVVLGALPPSASADAQAHARAASRRADLQERRWFHELGAAAQAQVIAGRLAATRGSTPAIRTLGNQLVRSHRKTIRKLTLLSLQTQEPAASRPDPAEERRIGSLRALHGAGFDRAFLQQFAIDLQRRELSLCDAALGRAGTSRALLDLAREMKPALEQQLARAEAVLAASPLEVAADAPAIQPLAAASARRPDEWDENERDALRGVLQAADVLRQLKVDPARDALVRRARGILVWTAYRNGGLLLGVRRAHGVLVTRHGEGFSAPAFYRMVGGSIGLQVGAASGATVYLLMTDAAVQQFRSPREISFDAFATRTLGDASQLRQSALGKVQDLVALPATHGAYAGVAVGLMRIVPDAAANRAYYGRDLSASEVLGGLVHNPHAPVLARAIGS